MTAILLLSDIHSNLPALDAVLEDAEKRSPYTEVWVSGDCVGYGAQPNEVIDRLRSLPGLATVKGNHEAAALREISVDDFNPVAAAAAIWTARTLNEQTRDFLRALPEKHMSGSVTLCHGTPRSPLWEYLLTVRTAEENLEHFDTTGCVHGHTHVPSAIGHNLDGSWLAFHAYEAQIVELDFVRWFVNPGSVGQPRDGDPRASYALLHRDDSDSRIAVQFHRVEYDVTKAQNLILEAGLPIPLAFRLAEGR